MIRAIMIRSGRNALPLFLLVAAGAIGLEMLYVMAMGNLAEDLLDLWRKIPFLKEFLRVLAGIDITGDVSTTSLITMGLVHPVLLAITWAFLLTTCTSDTVGIIESGVADLVLTLPISRAGVYAAVTAVWIPLSALLCAAAWCGIALGEQTFGAPEPLQLRRLILPATNLFALLVAIGAATMFVSTLVSRRGVAIAIMLVVLLASFLVNFLEVFVPAVKEFAFLGFLYYYKPVDVAMTGVWPLKEIGILGAAAAVLWTAGLWRFSRRDIPAA